jgi:hypothetical protein
MIVAMTHQIAFAAEFSERAILQATRLELRLDDFWIEVEKMLVVSRSVRSMTSVAGCAGSVCQRVAHDMSPVKSETLVREDAAAIVT